MNNDHAAVARDYHERTKHYAAAAPRRIETSIVPRDYKRYVNTPVIPLPAPAVSARTLFEVTAQTSDDPQALELGALAAVLHYSTGIVRRRRIGGREYAFRAAPCTGAAYHIELYVVCGNIGSPAAGVYHYDVPSETLRELRKGDYRHVFADASCDGAVASASACVVLTSTFWRNAWRYQERAYRHVFWDAGTLLANLLAVAESHSLRPMLHSAFVDTDLNALLGLDAKREAAVAVVSLGAGEPAGTGWDTAPPDLATEPLSRAEIEYPLIWQTHAATNLADREEVLAWRGSAQAETRKVSSLAAPVAALGLEASIERRGSARRFSAAALAPSVMRAVLEAATGSRLSDQAVVKGLIQTLLIVNRVEGMDRGVYSFDGRGDPTLLKRGDFALQAAHLALDQPAAGGAAVNMYFMARMDEVTRTLGGRGYRAVQLEAGIRTGQVYLAATTLGLRATGLTFYDDEVASFFGHDPVDTAVLMLVVLGAPASA